MQWRPLQLDALSNAAAVDEDHAVAAWRASGAAALTDPDVAVPTRLVGRVQALAAWLDARGARLAARTSAGGVGLLAERAPLLGLGRSGRTSCGGATRLVRAADGWLAVSLARDDDVELVPAWLERASVGDPWDDVEGVARHRPAAELRDRAALVGLACSVVGERAADDDAVLVSTIGRAAPASLDGMTVVNLAALWAGPLCAHLLGRLGATVVDVESTTRPDGGRATPTFHRLLHDGHRPVQVPLAAEAGRAQLRELLAGADVVIEGSRPRALAQLGIDAATLTSTGPRVWLSITAHGRTGDHAMRIGYGDDAAAAGGLVGEVDGSPRFLADAVADPLTGLVGAVTVAQLVEQGGRHVVDLALARVAASMRDRP